MKVKAGSSTERGMITTVNLLTLTIPDQLIFLLYKTSYTEKEVNCTEPSISVRDPWLECLSFTSLLGLI
jgi:hypothetical protein